MKAAFHAGGPAGFRDGKKSALWKSIEQKYADRLASATWLGKQAIRIEMQRELLRQKKPGHQPSPATLW